MRVVVMETASSLAEEAARIVIDELSVPGPATVGLAGGSTPLATYRLLADAGIDWGRASLWLGDERWVPPDDPASNSRTAREALGPAAGRSLLAPEFGSAGPQAAARAYEESLIALFAGQGGVPDTVLLGLGADGHTASLFPGTAALETADRLFVANWVPALDAWRLTATIELLASARHLVFLVAGEPKASVVAGILDDGIAHPAREVAMRGRHVTWLLDAAAASRLRSRRPRREPPA